MFEKFYVSGELTKTNNVLDFSYHKWKNENRLEKNI